MYELFGYRNEGGKPVGGTLVRRFRKLAKAIEAAKVVSRGGAFADVKEHGRKVVHAELPAANGTAADLKPGDEFCSIVLSSSRDYLRAAIAAGPGTFRYLDGAGLLEIKNPAAPVIITKLAAGTTAAEIDARRLPGEARLADLPEPESERMAPEPTGRHGPQ